MAGRFFVFSIHFVIWHISYLKSNFKILNVYFLVKRPLEKLHLHPQWGPDTHNSPHQRGGVSKAEQTLFVPKNHFKNYQKLFNLHSFIRNSFLTIYYSTCFKVKICFDHFGSQNNSLKTPLKYLIFSEK